MKSIVGVSIHANFIISFLVLFMFAMGMHVGGYAGVFVVLLFAANLLSSLFLVALSLHKDMLRVPSNFYYPAVLSCLAIFYFSVWIFGGLSAGQHVKDALGGSLKAMLPFIVFISFSMAFNRVSDKYGIYRFALVLMVFYGFVYAVGKIVLLSLGYFYGAGLSQYIVSSFVLALFFSAMVYKVKVRLSWFLLFLFLFLSVLSFKRTVWVQLLVAFFVFLYFFPKAKKLQLIFSAALGLAVAVTFFADSSLGDRIVSRFLYTF